MARAPDPIVVVLSSAQRTLRGMISAALSFLVGLASLAYAAFGSGNDPTARIGAIVVGVVLLLLGLLILAGMGVGIGGRDLTFTEDGLGWGGSGRRSSWQVEWDELAGASLHLGYRGRPVNRNYRVRIELRPVSGDGESAAAFEQRHPQLRRRRLRGADRGYSLALGPRSDLMDRIDNAFVIFAADRYQGMVDDGALGGPIAPVITGVRERDPYERRNRFGR